MQGQAAPPIRVLAVRPTPALADPATLAPADRAIRALEEGGDVPVFAADQLHA